MADGFFILFPQRAAIKKGTDFSGLKHPGHVSLDRGVGLEVEIFHQHVQHGRRYKCRQFRAERDVLDAEMEQGKKDEERNTRHLGELGIGLNPRARMSCNTLEDEKVGGTVHFAIGMNLEHDAHALIHLDCLVLSPDVYVDDEPVIREGRPLV